MPTMSENMGAMHGPAPMPPLVGRALNTSRLSDADRQRLRADAEQRVSAGLEQARRAAGELQAASLARERDRVDRALAALREAVTDVQTGRGVLDALAVPPAETEARALAWLKRELRLVDTVSQQAGAQDARRWLVVAALAVVAVLGVVLYLYKVGRSVRWLARLAQTEDHK